MGAIVNDSRSWVIQLQAFIDKDEAVVSQMAYRQIAWCYSLGQTLRGLDSMGNLKKYISEEDILCLHKHNNIPLAIIKLNTIKSNVYSTVKRLISLAIRNFDNTLI